MIPIVIAITPIATDMSAKLFQVICLGDTLSPSSLTPQGDGSSDRDHERDANDPDQDCKLVGCHWVAQASTNIISPPEPERKS